MVDVGDDVHAKKIIDLYEKETKNEHIVGFTGHFSAGKSSIINYVLGTNVLPKSPIPTSANIVKITSGTGLVHVYFKDKTIYEYAEPYDIDLIQDYCQDKDTIEQVSIQLSNTSLPDAVALLDTPGIDAADDTDRLITESSLHLIDTLFYVMDYHHVQSEVNLQFLQQMQANHIPIYMIINQIDKHFDKELSFNDFKLLITNTCQQWEIHPEKIYYTSTIDFDTPYNEIDMFKSDFFQLINVNEHRVQRTKLAMTQLVNDHEQVLRDTFEQELVNIEDNELNDIHLKEINQQIEKSKVHLEKFTQAFMSEVDFTLKNAYLMPATLREFAHRYLESSQQDFKVGFFGNKKKTKVEKLARKNAFLENLQRTMDATIQWKLREKLIHLMQQYHMNNEPLIEQAQQITVQYKETDLLRYLRDGATINGHYILNYTNDISSDIKSQYRKQSITLLQKIKQFYEPILTEKLTALNSKLKHLTKINEIRSKNTLIQNELKRKIDLLHSDIENISHSEKMHQKFSDMISSTYHIEKQPSMVPLEKKNIQQQKLREHKGELEKTYEPKSVINAIDLTINELNQLEGFQTYIESLQQQKETLENRQVTIALFGAFSAGKSSFSNALLGEKILPSSPNPTTAVINRITSPTKTHPHGTVKITFKDEQTMLEDVKLVTNIRDYGNDSFIQLTNRALDEDKEIDDMYRAFLFAIKQGFESNKDSIGRTVTIPYEHFASFVTDESKACFIEEVDLYYECEFTKKGLTIVDTPGADSVNARHTNVAFDYIKYTDVILYVTYYNHAVTSADRDFLMQLGRVKDSFTLDKMFFIVNAADLAHNDSDLKLVVNYVNEQLLSLGIRNANIFPVSSKQSLIEKQQQEPLNEAMKKFEQTFNLFIEEGLTQLATQTAVWEIRRISTNLKQRIHAASLKGAERDKYVSQLNKNHSEGQSIITKEKGSLLQERLNERIERQLHYVLERLYIRFHDMFSEYFNPTTVTETGKQVQQQLTSNGSKLIEYVGYELLQEIRAVSLRIEAFLNELLEQKHIDFKKQLADLIPTLMLAPFLPFELVTPDYKQAFDTLTVEEFSKSLKVYKNKKSFFEQNEREKMKELFYGQLQPFATAYIDKHKLTMQNVNENQLHSSLDALKQKMINELNDYICEQKRVVKSEVDIDLLKNTDKEIAKFIKQL